MSHIVLFQVPCVGGKTINQLIVLVATKQKVYIYDGGVIFSHIALLIFPRARSLSRLINIAGTVTEQSDDHPITPQQLLSASDDGTS